MRTFAMGDSEIFIGLASPSSPRVGKPSRLDSGQVSNFALPDLEAMEDRSKPLVADRRSALIMSEPIQLLALLLEDILIDRADQSFKPYYGPNSLSICAALNQSAKLSTNAEQNNSINVLRAAGKNLNLLLSAKSFRAVGYWPSKQKNQEASPSQQQHKLRPEPIPEEQCTLVLRPQRARAQSEPRFRGRPLSARTQTSARGLFNDPRDKSITKSMPLEDIRPRPSRSAQAQTSRYLYEAVVKVDSAFKKKARRTKCRSDKQNHRRTFLNSNKLQSMPMLAEEARKMVQPTEAFEKERAGILDGFLPSPERDEWQTRGSAWPRKKKIVYRKGVEDAYLRAQKEMILKFK
ncbi:hypothetical protein FNV43_RR08065 [Rhamnella rubrinervis]|uniref:Uncharacterized protein n=1 Tax=Rhamnella rubrinervis TaxID=2594499 RepID=A0A8K0MN14_9ROSA|nr:hypothetical protein FNV43_RR08065 [Rhamnella rubrinervis]